MKRIAVIAAIFLVCMIVSSAYAAQDLTGKHAIEKWGTCHKGTHLNNLSAFTLISQFASSSTTGSHYRRRPIGITVGLFVLVASAHVSRTIEYC